MAAFYYVAFAFELMTGVIPRGSGDPAKFYRDNPVFFWVYILIVLALFLYQLIRGIFRYREQRQIGEPGKGFTTRTASIITAALTISIGVCFFILPVVEILKATAYGGYVFKTHQIASEPAPFFTILSFHFAATIIPIIAGVLLLAFPPKGTWEIQPITNTVMANQ